ncbi:splicing factor U2AF large subunit, putative [Plasmodium berghei]|uniref:Splicing factor U2AF large subunit, putative n=2 Tax=Plasmodium berghei TaxID=5821 RepID=A0A509AQ58_PLABA|nr:splicing factor U2AF large subunit, putative [Plasmodium berghei ANKA]CXI96435.1 splicing factor U2AF large subunit, putative [Plasmodium berghei]SCL97324.1 splicing factor U2AF large subunit, putative [Plasmodium berghei]SCM16595.1 splicing factor U2AF large subunit, putative [Plasmodium berghei]SCM18392.1 splicing factor U2AF large subunit, putative [Plasmodium berghei]SCN27822.1 splicing factor U2AF large subunit, putative [Plasmodium berghei]|eukprot:XP_034423476.1 splicing factor U2AF large subunit, putative [Plasmodium berghei ANKA]
MFRKVGNYFNSKTNETKNEVISNSTELNNKNDDTNNAEHENLNKSDNKLNDDTKDSNSDNKKNSSDQINENEEKSSILDKKTNADFQEKIKIIKEKLKSNEFRNEKESDDKDKGSNKDISRGRNKDKERSRDNDKDRRRHKELPSSDDEIHSSKRKRRSKERRRDKSVERRRRNKSKERSRGRSRYKRSKDDSRNISNSRSDSDHERNHYHKSKKSKKYKSSWDNSDKNYSDDSTKERKKNTRDKNDISMPEEDTKKENKEIKPKKKKSKWDTVDESLLKNNILIDSNNLSGVLQYQRLGLNGNLLQGNKGSQLSRNSYELEGDKKQRKLYIGNLPPNSKQEEIVEFFNNTISSIIKGSSLEVKIGDVQLLPVVKCEIFNADSRFCFLEFRTMDITWLCLKLDSMSYNNYCLRINRPHDYMPPPEGDPALTVVFPDIDMGLLESFKPPKIAPVRSTGDDDNKLYIQNLPHDLKDDQIMDLLGQFGKLKGFNIIKDLNTGLNKGYGFFEYEDSSCTQVAIHALNGFVCGKNILNVKKATFNKNSNNAPNSNNIVLANNVDVPVSLLPNSISQKILSNSIIGLQIQASRKIGEKSSRVIQLTNAVFQEDLIIDSQYDEILKDVKEEAEKYGPLQSIVIPKPNTDLSYTEGVGKIFLHYVDETAARKAQYMFNGRLFEKRVVCASFYSEEKFLKGKYVLS